MKYIRRAVVLLFTVTLITYIIYSFISAGKVDQSAPVIASDSDTLEVPSAATDEQLLAGLTATDKEDGDLTAKIRVGTHSDFSEKGICQLNYLVFDSQNAVGQYSRMVTYTDYHSPTFSLSEPLMYNENQNVTILDRLSANDVLTGDISQKIKIVDGNVDAAVSGTYTLGVEAANDYGDIVSLNLPVHIAVKVYNAPVITLSTYLIYSKVGTKIDPYAYLAQITDSKGSPLDMSAVIVQSAVDAAQPGVYEVAYQYTQENGSSGLSYLIVVVEE